MKGSAITGPVGKEAAELWPVSHSSVIAMTRKVLTHFAAYCQQLRCRDVKGFLREGVRIKGQAARGDVDSRAMTTLSSGARGSYGKRPQKGLAGIGRLCISVAA
jgi:hypothetical protein